MAETRDDTQERPRTAGEMLARAREFLARKAIPDARLEAELLVAHALGLDRLHLYLALDRPIEEAELARARDAIVRRGKREPTAYIVGQREFYGRPFSVDRSVLIPRSETELIVDAVRERFPDRSATLRLGDIGTGSGCLAVTLALEFPSSSVTAVDLSRAALEVARANAAKLLAEVEFVEADGARGLGQGPFDAIVSNPPYVAEDERQALAPEVRDHEPSLALFAPSGDPDHWVSRLLSECWPLLNPGGVLWIELGHRQGARALELAARYSTRASLRYDLQRIGRVLEVQRV